MLIGEQVSGRKVMDERRILSVIASYQGKTGRIMSILEELQEEYGYLSHDVLSMVAKQTGKSLVDIYGVATFYKYFSLKPKGKHVISVCLGTACHVRGAVAIVNEFESQLGIKVGETTFDQEFTLETVNCLGACALGPIVCVDGTYYSKVNTAKVRGIIDETRNKGNGTMAGEQDAKEFNRASCPFCGHSLIDRTHLINRHPSIHVQIEDGPTLIPAWLPSKEEDEIVEYGEKIPGEKRLRFLCPHCHNFLSDSIRCPECSAPMVQVNVDGGKRIMICSTKGCRGQRLNLVSAAIAH